MVKKTFEPLFLCKGKVLRYFCFTKSNLSLILFLSSPKVIKNWSFFSNLNTNALLISKISKISLRGFLGNPFLETIVPNNSVFCISIGRFFYVDVIIRNVIIVSLFRIIKFIIIIIFGCNNVCIFRKLWAIKL